MNVNKPIALFIFKEFIMGQHEINYYFNNSKNKEKHNTMNETSSNKLLNAVDFSDLNSLDATTLMTMNLTTTGSPMQQDKPLLMSSPPKITSEDYKILKKRKLEEDGDKTEFIKSNNNRKRQLQNNNYQKIQISTDNNLLDSDFFAYEGTAIESNKITKDSLLTTVSQNIFNAPENETMNYPNNQYTYFESNEEAYENLAFCNEYKDDILKNMYTTEKSYCPNLNPCLVDKEVSRIFIKPSMRAILIDWLIQVSRSFRLSKGSFLLAMSIIDRYLACNRVSLKKLQLLTITAIFMAAKCEEVKLPKLSKYCEMTDKSYTTDEMLSAEMAILQSLEFKMSPPSQEIFMFEYLNIFRNEMDINLEKKNLDTASMNEDELYRVNRLLLQTSYKEDMIEEFGYLLIQYILTSPHFIHLKISYQCSLAVYLIRLMYHQDMQVSMNSVINDYFQLKDDQGDSFGNEDDEVNYKFCNKKDKLKIYNNNIKQIWPDSMISITNGIIADEDFQEHIRILIMEIADPSTNLPSIMNQDNYHYCNVLKTYCSLINN